MSFDLDSFGKNIFDEHLEANNIDDLYIGMPEYNNHNQEAPVITATFKFRTEEDYEEFKELIKQHIYNGVKPFDGMQRKEKKQAWYPHKEKASKYVYVDGEPDAS